MKNMRLLLPLLGMASLLGPLAHAGEAKENHAKDTDATRMQKGEMRSDGHPRAGADNTETNKRDRNSAEPTADQQKNNKSDLDLTAQIRRSIMADKSLSTSAHNVKIIAQNGVVTVKGPVKSAAEKTIIEQKAEEVAGKSNTRSEIEVAP